MSQATISQTEMIGQLAALGVQAGGVLLVHSAFSRVRPVAGGPLGLIAALLAALGPSGTLVMPSLSDDDEHPFDPAHTPCPGMGVVADTFWRQAGVWRSDSPHAFAARGPQAERLTAPHPVHLPHGLDSPVGRVYELDGQVLLLGVGHAANTTLHLCEALAGVRYRTPKHVHLLIDGQVRRVDYGETDHCCQNFNLVDAWLEAEGLQRRGRVGHAEARLMRSRDLVRSVVPRLQQDETVFLHPVGVDAECDAARASLAVDG
jgi:aminoglycoside 3-N-acetyltransferase